MKSFVNALDAWSRTGLAPDFAFAGSNVRIGPEEEFADVVFRLARKDQADEVAGEVNSALDWWMMTSRAPDATEAAPSGRATYKILELLMSIAAVAHAITSARHFRRAFGSEVFRRLPLAWAPGLVSECVSMVGRWCLQDASRLQQWPPDHRAAVRCLLQWLATRPIDQQDAVVCLASMARLDPEWLPSYLHSLLERKLLPRAADLKLEPAEFDDLRSVLAPAAQKRAYEFETLLRSDSPQMEYREMFGLPESPSAVAQILLDFHAIAYVASGISASPKVQALLPRRRPQPVNEESQELELA